MIVGGVVLWTSRCVYHMLCQLRCCNAAMLQALAEQRVQAGLSMDSYAAQLHQGSLTIFTWQAEMAALHGAPRSGLSLPACLPLCLCAC